MKKSDITTIRPGQNIYVPNPPPPSTISGTVVLDANRDNSYNLGEPVEKEEAQGVFIKFSQKVKEVLKYAESNNGIHWKRHGHIAIELKAYEYGIARRAIDNEQISKGE